MGAELVVCRGLSERAKREICGWKYPGEYGIYDLPSYEEMEAKHMGLLSKRAEDRYFGFWEGNTLVGFVNLLEEPAQVFLGIGVRPDLCGKHYGQQMLSMAYDISKELYPQKPLYLEVRTWNTRAVTCYEKAGFHIDGQPYALTTTIGTGTFFRMVRE